MRWRLSARRMTHTRAGANPPSRYQSRLTARIYALRTVTPILIVAPVLLLVPVLVPIAAAVGYPSLWANHDVTLTQASRGGDSATVYHMLLAGTHPSALLSPWHAARALL